MDDNAWDERYRGSDLVWSAGPNAFVADRCAPLAPGRALDVACGEGRNALWLAERGWSVVGIDFSPVAIDKARRIAGRRDVTVDWRVGDVTAFDGSGRFDLIVVAYLHLAEPTMGEVLVDLAGRLAPGGTLFVLGHHVDNPDRGHGGPPDRSVLHDPDVVAAAVSAEPEPALVLDEAGEVTRRVTTDAGERTAIDSLVVAHAPGESGAG